MTSYYQILNLPFTNPPVILSKQQIKVAYHKALLRNHPDKCGAIAVDSSSSNSSDNPSSASTVLSPSSNEASDRQAKHRVIYTIDQITAAYKILVDPVLRADYDRSLRLDHLHGPSRQDKASNIFHTGLEIVDLEDLIYEEGGDAAASDQTISQAGGVWYRGCRCGDEKGFLIVEEQLEQEAEYGEIVVGCRGCSLWLKVLFAVDAEAVDGR